MKKTIATLLPIALILAANATVRTVNNNSNSPGQYTDVAAAYNASSPGDTIYIAGSSVTYYVPNITKQLVIIGSGYKPNKQMGLKTVCNGISIARTDTTDPSGTIIMGIEGTIYLAGFDDTKKLSNISIVRCKLVSGFQLPAVNVNNDCGSGIIIYNNVFAGGGFSINIGSGSPNILVRNNIINSGLSTNYNITGTIDISNNIFCGAGDLGVVKYGNIYNNIFYGLSPNSSSSYCAFNNNLSYNTSNNNFDTTGNFNSGGNNIIAADPLFVNVLSVNYNDTYDYHLLSNSPGINAGTDGNDIGIYGGSNPFPLGGGSGSGYQTSPTPRIPLIYEMNVINGTVPPGGNLNINIKVKQVE